MEDSHVHEAECGADMYVDYVRCDYHMHVGRTTAIRSRQANDLHHTIRPEKDPDVHVAAACLILYDVQKDRIASLWLWRWRVEGGGGLHA
jgi:hypothetical protein